jgi:hypothetical protein
MAYGRLDVFGPDGIIRTFQLADLNVSVGRSTGNTITLDNTSISRYHFSITREKDEIYITDLESANGTHVDGVKLVGNERRLLGGGEEILIGNLRIIFHRLDASPTQPVMPLAEVTQRIESADAEFVVDLHGPDQSVAPGAHISAELSITNLVDEDRRYVIEVSGLPKEWVRVDRPTPFIEAQDSTFVLVNFRPLRRSESKPGDYNVKIRVYPQDKPAAVIETTLALSVLPYSGFGVALQPARLESDSRFQLYLHNQGSASLPLRVYTRDRAGELDLKLSSSKVTLAPGQQLAIQGEARPRNTMLAGQPRRYPFDVLIRSENHAGFITPLRLYYLHQPLLPGWGPLLLISLVGLFSLALVVLLAVLLLRPAPQPSFSDFYISSTQVAQGDMLEVRWQATDVVEYRLVMNETPVRAASDPRATAFADVDTSGFSGQVVVRLEGFNGDQHTSREQLIEVYIPVTSVERFVVSPPQLVRYVVQSLGIEWHVPGAVATYITGLEAFSTLPIEADGPSGAVEDVVGIPRDPITLRLIARDAGGNTLEETLTINVVNPECTPAGSPVTLYAGPGQGYQVIGTVPEGETVVINAQDVSGQWLRILLPGDQTGWGRLEAFACAGNFVVADLFREANVPPLPPTLTPTLLPPPTLTPVPSPTPPPASG